MTNQEFLKANREEVVNFYNTKINGLYNISLKDFMVDLLNNFRKVTMSEGLKRMDLMANLQEAQIRLGTFDVKIGVTYSKPYSESNHAKAVAYFGADQVKMMSNAK
jgi:lysyl-tRNA synthetase class II